MPAVRRLLSCALVALSMLVLATAASTPAATSGTVVSATVPSATSVDASACATGVAGSTDLGVVLPGSSAVSTLDCTVRFGSSNDTAKLRAWQEDISGRAMLGLPSGPYDMGFSGNGFDDRNPPGSNDTGWDLVQQADGKLVIAGSSSPDIVLVRYDTGGTPDGTFGTAGVVTTDIAGNPDTAYAIGLQSDGRIVIAGITNVGGQSDIFVARYDTDGVLDPGFGTAGVTTFDFAADNDYAYDLAIDSQDRIVIAGNSRQAGVTDLVLMRVLADGSMLDPTFGTAGVTKIDAGNNLDSAKAVQVMQDGRIVFAGQGWTGNQATLVGRLLPDGAPDPAFGTAGIAMTNAAPTGEDYADAVAVRADGSVYAVGRAWGGADRDFLVIRYDANGVEDPSFGTGGIATTHIGTGTNNATAAAVHGDGRIAVFGYGLNGGQVVGAVARYRNDGSLDSTFNGTGTLLMVSPSQLWAYGALMQADGKYVMTGAHGTFLRTVRFDGSSVPDYDDLGNDDWSTPSAALFGACLRAASAGATTGAGTWTVDADATCTASDSDPWQPIVSTMAGAGSTIATTAAAGTVNARVDLRFGMRAAPAQAPGAYQAWIVFETVAPNT